MQEAQAAGFQPQLQLQRSLTAGELKRSNSSSNNNNMAGAQRQSRSRRGANSGGGGGGGSKPTLEIYRPPNVRVDGLHMNGEAKLNVHAKEFTMQTGDIKTSRSSGNILAMNNHNVNHNNNNSSNNNNIISSSKGSKSAHLHQSKSSGNILHVIQQQNQHHHQHHQQRLQSGNVLQQSHRVHFRFEGDSGGAGLGLGLGLTQGLGQVGVGQLVPQQAHVLGMATHAEGYAGGGGGGGGGGRSKAHHRLSAALPDHLPLLVDDYQPQSKPLRSKTQAAISTGQNSGGIKRSKSMGSADALGAAIGTACKDLSDFANLPSEVQAAIHRAVEDPNQVSARTLMQLVRHIMDKVVESRSFAEPAAKLCITIIEKEKNETFLESLLNTCQLWYQNRDKYLKTPSASTAGSNGMRYPAFMAFLNEMYCQLKRRQLQLKTQYDGVAPGLLLLTLLAKCCQECLKPPAVNSLKEMECLFFVLSSIGRDLETELPTRMNAVLAGVRDAFLTTAAVPAIRKTLLQLIELHAAQWQLPAPAIMYYYPTTNK